MLVVLAVALLVMVVWLDVRYENKHGAGEEHRFTATGACMSGRHYNCSGNVHYITKRAKTPCTCPCHKEEQ